MKLFFRIFKNYHIMDDLLQKQIVESCRLALPNGLKELMSDMSREVLRAQPNNLYKFITDCLSSLLVTRDNMTIAARVCSKLCDCTCGPELEDELRYIGLDEETASDAMEVIEKFLGRGEVDEGHLLLKLMKKTSLTEEQLPAVTAATRRAFLKHLRNRTHIYESSSNSEDDETETAVKNTLRLYRKTDPGQELYHCMARKIQASYRAYQVRRQMTTRKLSQVSRKSSKTGSMEKSKVTFGTVDSKICTSSHDGISEEDLEGSEGHGETNSHKKTSITSLAGSYLSLPKYKPYSAHDCENLSSFEQLPEKERSNFDYTREDFSIVDIDGINCEANDKTDNSFKGYEEDYNYETNTKEVEEENTENDEEIEDITENLYDEDGRKFYEAVVVQEETVSGEEIEDMSESLWEKEQERFGEETTEKIQAKGSLEEKVEATNEEGIFGEEITENGDEMVGITEDMWKIVQETFEETYEKRTSNSVEVMNADDISGNAEEHFDETELSEAESEYETVADYIPEGLMNIDEED